MVSELARSALRESTEILSLDALAVRCGFYSYDKFRRQLKAESVSYNQLKTEERLRRIREAPPASLKEGARLCGFSHERTYSLWLKQQDA